MRTTDEVFPWDITKKEQRYNWELIFCEMYAGGKYNNNSGENYEYSLGLNGLGACATQYSSEFMDAEIRRDGFVYRLHFEKGENIGGLTEEPTRFKATGTKITWRPDIDVLRISISRRRYFINIMRKQAV